MGEQEDQDRYTIEGRLKRAAEVAKKKGGSEADVREAARSQFGDDVDEDYVRRVKEKMRTLA